MVYIVPGELPHNIRIIPHQSSVEEPLQHLFQRTTMEELPQPFPEEPSEEHLSHKVVCTIKDKP